MKVFYYVVIFLFLFSGEIKSQGTKELENECVCHALFTLKAYNPTPEQLEISMRNIEELRQCILISDPNNSKRLSCLYLTLANSSFLIKSLDQDEVISNVSRSFSLDTVGFCENYMEVISDYTPSFLSSFDKYFIDEISTLEIDKIKKYCNSNFTKPIKEKVIDEYKNVSYRLALDSVSVMDQLYRREGRIVNPKEQDKIDQKNRSAIDSLYVLYGFPTFDEVGNGVKIVFHVLLHSKDCQWNEKWLDLFIPNTKNIGEVDKRLYWVFERFFDPSEGYCSGNSRSRDFIGFLRRKYSKEKAKLVGYDDFFPEFNSTYPICGTEYKIDHSIRLFSKSYVVDQRQIEDHLNCLLVEVKKGILSDVVIGHVYNEIAQDYALLGDKEQAMNYIIKFASSDWVLFKLIFKKYESSNDESSYFAPYYLNDFSEFIYENYGAKLNK